MAVTSTDIVNRALQLIGTRTNIASLSESSNEAIQANICYTAVRDWCLGVTNWNFARRTAALSIYKANTVPPTVPWATATSISPPWINGYLLPADCLRVQYITNSDLNSTSLEFLGEPKRFVIACDTNAGVQQRVLLTKENPVTCIYTAQITDPTEWPWMFERFAVSALAWTLCMALTGDKDQVKTLDASMERFLDIAIQANTAEGLAFGDTTPEWIQALGINYPYRRQDGKSQSPPQQGRGSDNSR